LATAVPLDIPVLRHRYDFDRYNIVSESDLRAGVDRLAAYVKKLPKGMNVEPLKKGRKARG
jgi:hypothetical protein